MEKLNNSFDFEGRIKSALTDQAKKYMDEKTAKKLTDFAASKVEGMFRPDNNTQVGYLSNQAKEQEQRLTKPIVPDTRPDKPKEETPQQQTRLNPVMEEAAGKLKGIEGILQKSLTAQEKTAQLLEKAIGILEAFKPNGNSTKISQDQASNRRSVENFNYTSAVDLRNSYR